MGRYSSLPVFDASYEIQSAIRRRRPSPTHVLHFGQGPAYDFAHHDAGPASTPSTWSSGWLGLGLLALKRRGLSPSHRCHQKPSISSLSPYHHSVFSASPPSPSYMQSSDVNSTFPSQHQQQQQQQQQHYPGQFYLLGAAPTSPPHPPQPASRSTGEEDWLQYQQEGQWTTGGLSE
ncbi:hypothetical protein TYRP_001416 [Tyrophagus putrescentiae]|nr:hypothetical protein TYRP_001416 [Tyrophagus putrescentiae]